jgi:co-chaperonin GroES (HSP10)
MRAIGKYVVINALDEEIRTDSGLILSGKDAQGFRYKKGRVVSVGTDVLAINEGDLVYYDKGHSFTMIIGESNYTIIQERDVVVVE